MVIIPLNMQISTSSISGIPEQYMSFPMAALIAQTVTEFFQWFSGITKTGRHAMLRFELMDFYQGLRATRIVSGDDSNKFEIMKSTAWNSFLRRPSGDAEEAAALRIIITPCSTQPPHSTPFDPVLNSVNTNTANTTIPISGNQSAPASAQTNGELGHASLFHDSSSHQPQPPSSKTPSAKIVIRIQVDGLGRLSRSYDKSVLNSKVNNAKFFEWFAQETGHTGSQKLKFDFKDALPSKSSIVERDNEDHFDLMIHDIKRKFNHAQAYTPDMNEFGILVTDPMWDSGDEDEDEME
jgi:hypothetical protein